MAEPHLKARPSDDGLLTFEMDREGYDLFKRLISRAQPHGHDNELKFNDIKSRINGAFLAGAVVMGWESKGA